MFACFWMFWIDRRDIILRIVFKFFFTILCYIRFNHAVAYFHRTIIFCVLLKYSLFAHPSNEHFNDFDFGSCKWCCYEYSQLCLLRNTAKSFSLVYAENVITTCTNVHAQYQCVRDTVNPYLSQHLVMLKFLICANYSNVK